MHNLTHNQRGANIILILVVIIVFALLVGTAFLMINNEKAKTRDAKRLSDVTRIQAAFEFLYNDTARYTGASLDGCNQVGMLVSSCNLSAYLPSIRQFQDPGKFAYTISVVPDEEQYQVTFTLEKKYDGLAAGTHTVSSAGIQ